MMKYLQRIGRSLMLPVAVLPAGALLMGIGYWIDPTGWGAGSPVANFFIKAGGALIDNLPLLFAMGVAYGMTKKQDGASIIAGVVAWLTITTLLNTESVANLTSMPVEEVSPAFGKIANAFTGILSGLIGAFAFDKFHNVQLPTAFAFFSGKRLAPIMASLMAIVASLVLFFIWPAVYGGLIAFGTGMSKLGAFGAGLFGFFNRLLIPTGLHHALNAVFWFDTIGINDLGKFWGSPELGGVVGETGRYMAGFFPIMMFGLPGGALAMYRKARPENKKVVASLFIAAATASFVTGVTEPLEFSFMFAAPALYLIHAGLTGLSLFITASFKWFAGFGFSAGVLDYILSFRVPYATNIIMLIPLGLAFFAIYYFTFSWAIDQFDLKTPGREDIIADGLEEDNLDAQATETQSDYARTAKTIFDALGGNENIEDMTFCATRLRLNVKDSSIINDAKIKAAGSPGILTPSKTTAQVIIGTHVQFVADEFEKLLK